MPLAVRVAAHLRRDGGDAGEHRTARRGCGAEGEPGRCRATATRASACSNPATSDAPIETSSAAASSPCLPTTPALTSSARPESSSARVWRTTVSIAMTPVSSARNPPMRHATKPPAVVRSYAGPYSTFSAGEVPSDATSASR